MSKLTIAARCAVSVLLTAFAASTVGAIDRDVTINGSSLANPIGVGFGNWEGAEPVRINLSAEPGEIGSAQMFAPEAVIWSPTDVAPPDPWVFETVGILPDEPFAVKFKGTYAGEGETPPPIWAVAISQVDLDCDSLNASIAEFRAPSESDAEDSAEYPAGPQAQGMTMNLGADWAMVKVNAGVKRTSTLRLQAETFGLAAFQLADDNFTVLDGNGLRVDGIDQILFQQTVQAGEVSWTFYIKPTAAAQESDQIAVRAVIIAQGPSENQPADNEKAVDEMLVDIDAKGDVAGVFFRDSETLDLADNPDAAKYGELRKGTNPDGKEVAENMHRHQLKSPAYQGGDRFFPDASKDDVDTGRNIVRVSAHVKDMAVGDTVLFRSFDVDDPSDTQYKLAVHKTAIDASEDAGADNRGRLAGANIHRAGPSAGSGAGGWHGRLRAVNAGEPLGAWSAAGAIVPGKVKKWIVGGVEQMGGDGKPVLIADVDLLTSFAPGDNFRVVAVPERMRPALEKSHVEAPVVPSVGKPLTKEQTEKNNHRIPTNNVNKYFSTQLAIWRHLYVENDAAAALYGLMSNGVVRQTNRFADAYLEPEYDTLAAVNTGAPAVGGRKLGVTLVGPLNGTVDADDVAVINAARQSAALESRQFWVVYVTDTFASPDASIFGLAFNKNTATPFQAGVIFPGAITAFYPAEAAPVAMQKTTLHEVAHQILQPGGPGADKDGHRGTADSIDLYNAAAEANKLLPIWMNTINIMNSDANRVAMNNPASGPKDWYFFHASDIDAMRRLDQP